MRLIPTMLARPALALSNLCEFILWRRSVRAHKLTQPPTFIIGHWRSGTTLLHGLMASDPQWGVMTNMDAFFPWLMHSKGGRVRRWVGSFIPPQRWDGVALHPDSPQEEEIALLRLFGESAYKGWWQPDLLPFYFEKYALLQFPHQHAERVFAEQYLYLTKKLSMAKQGRPLLLKNPPNTGRVAMLLRLFPNARFIYLFREEDAVLRSAVTMHRSLIARFAGGGEKHFEALPGFVKALHGRLLDKYAHEQKLIPPRQLVEVSYDAFVSDPLLVLRYIYGRLQLTGFEAALPLFEQFLAGEQGHRCADGEPPPFVAKHHEPVKPNWQTKLASSSS